MQKIGVLSKLKPTVTLILILSVIAIFCKKVTDEENAQAKEDVVNIIKKTKEIEASQLNLGDESQFRFYMNHLKMAGISKETSPKLFSVIEGIRQKHTSSPPGKMTELAAGSSSPDSTVVTIYTLTGISPTGQPKDYTGSALSSIPGKTIYSVITIMLYDYQGNPMDTLVEISEGYCNGEYLPVKSIGTLSQQSFQANDSVTAVSTFLYVDSTNTPHGPFTIKGTTVTVPTQITNNDPMPLAGHDSTVVCLSRTAGNCTYTYQSTANNVMFPVKGNITYKDNIKLIGGKASGVSNITIAQTTGGGCVATMLNNQNFFNIATVQGKNISWNINPAQFQNTCMKSLIYTTYTFVLGVQLVTGDFVLSTITNAPNVITDSSTLAIPAIYIVAGCLAEGTLITMADGTKKPIEKIDVDEKVLSNDKGTLLTVENYVHGYEKVPSIRIEDDKGHNLLLTEAHPVITTKGVKVADALVIGDEVYTDKGTARLTRVTKEQYDKKVWNMDVGVKNDGVQFTLENTTFYANGILVGDGKMQRHHYWIVYRHDKETVLKCLPKEWHQDYLNYLERHKK